LPNLARIVDAIRQALRLLLLAYLEPELDELDPRVDHRFLDGRHIVQKLLRLLLGAEAHHALDTRAVVPAAIEDHDLAGRREVPDVALHVHLRLLAYGRGSQGDHPEHPGTDPLGDPLDGSPLAGRVTTFEHDADLGAGGLDPLLQGNELAVETPHLALVLLALHLGGRARLGLPPCRGSRRTLGVMRGFLLLLV